VIFLFFSLSKGKRSLYLLPLHPAVSLMIAKAWNDYTSTSVRSFVEKWFSFSLYIFIVVAFVMGAILPWIVRAKFPSYLIYSLPIHFLLMGGSILFFILVIFKLRAALPFIVVTILSASFFYSQHFIFPIINTQKSARFLAEEIESKRQPGDRVGVYGRVSAAPYNFYTGVVPIRELYRPEELSEFLRSSDRVFCLLTFKEFDGLQRRDGWPEVHSFARRRVGDQEIILISNQSGPPCASRAESGDNGNRSQSLEKTAN
jgi:hypothetical protein